MHKIYLEYILSKILKIYVNIRLYNIIDLFRLSTKSNMFQLIILRSLYFLPKEQKRYGFGIKIYMTYLTLGIMLQNSSLIGMVFFKTLKKLEDLFLFFIFEFYLLKSFFIKYRKIFYLTILVEQYI